MIVAHRPHFAAEMSARRDKHIAELEQDAARGADKLDGQDGRRKHKGRKPSDSGAQARLYQAVCEAKLASIIRVDLKSDLFTYDIDERALTRARMMDGNPLLVTNVPELTPIDVVKRYKSLADIERGFRVLKSEIEIGPVFHRLPDRTRAHAMICFLALVLYPVMHMRLKARDKACSPERALEIVRRIQFHQVVLHRRQSATGLSTLTSEQKELFDALNLPIPTIRSL
jgi:transposase